MNRSSVRGDDPRWVISTMSKQFGKYELLERIGKGGMAEVYRARSVGAEGIEKQLVIKKILPHLASNERFVEMFIDEAKIAMGLNHPNIVQIYDFGKVDDDYYLAMEYVDGVELKHLLDASARTNQPLSTGNAAYVASEVARGLDYAHRRRNADGGPLEVVHRDISPENLMISWDGAVKIVDFGIATAARMQEESPDELRGKYAYMSPEQARGEAVDRRSDVFSLGAVLFEMVCQRPLFRGDSPEETLSLVASAVVPEITALNPEIPEQLERILYKALARDPEERFEDARTFQMELTRLLHDLSEIHDAVTVGDHVERVESLLPEDTAEVVLMGQEGSEAHQETVVTTASDTRTPAVGIDEMPTSPRSRRVRERKEVVCIAGWIAGIEAIEEQRRRREAVDDYRRLVESIAYKYDAVVDELDDDTFALLLGIPVSREDDADRGLRMAFDLQDALSGMGYGVDFSVRAALGVVADEIVLDEVVDSTGRYYDWERRSEEQSAAMRVADRTDAGDIVVDARIHRRVRRSFDCEPIDSDGGGGDSEVGGRDYYLVVGEKTPSTQIRELRRSFHSFYGREISRRLLRTKFQQILLEERAGGVIFTGPAGIGKSTLVEKFLSELDTEDVRVVRGVASPFERDVPLSSARALYAEMLGLNLDQDDEKIRRDLGDLFDRFGAHDMGGRRNWYEQSLLDLFCSSAGEGEEPATSGRERRRRLFAVLAELTNRLAETQPLVVAVDDVHHIDPVMMAFAADYFDRTQPVAVMFVGTARDEGDHADSRVWGELMDARHLEIEGLDPLAPADAERMIRELLAAYDLDDEALVDRVIERAGGNPLYIREVVESLDERAAFETAGGLEENSESTELLPPGVEGVMRARIDRLEVEQREALKRLSLLPSPFSTAQARAVLDGSIVARLDALSEAQLLERFDDEDGPDQFRFANGIAREIAARRLVDEEADRLHRRIAEQLLEQREQYDSARIARHFEWAGEVQRALDLYEEAIEEALDHFGPDQCLELCGRMLQHAELGDRRRLRVLRWRHEALEGLGEVDGVEDVLVELEEVAERVGEPADRIDAAIRRARFYFDDGIFEAAREHAEHALSLAEEHGDRLGRANAWRITAAIEMSRGNRDRALTLVDRALAMLHVGSDRELLETMAELYNVRGVILRQSGRHREALEAYETALAAMEGVESTSLQRTLLLNFGLAFSYVGEFAKAKQRYQRALESSRRLGYRRDEALLLVNLGHLYQMIGRYDRSIQCIRRGIHLGKRTESPKTVADGEITLGLSHLENGDIERGRTYLERGYQRAESIPNVYLAVCGSLGMVQLRFESNDDPREIVEQLEKVLKRCRRTGMRWGVIVAKSLLARALERQDATDVALQHSTEAVEMLDEVELLGIDDILVTHAELLEGHEDRREERRECIRRAIEVFERRRDALEDERDRRAYTSRKLAQKIEGLAEALTASRHPT